MGVPRPVAARSAARPLGARVDYKFGAPVRLRKGRRPTADAAKTLPLPARGGIALTRGAGYTRVANSMPEAVDRGSDFMKSMSFRAAVAFAAILLPVAAYAASQTEPVKPLPPQQKNFPLSQTWQLRELNGKPVSADLDVSLKIDSAFRASGYTGCNSWSATMYPVKDQHLAVGPFALTKKQCYK